MRMVEKDVCARESNGINYCTANSVAQWSIVCAEGQGMHSRDISSSIRPISGRYQAGKNGKKQTQTGSALLSSKERCDAMWLLRKMAPDCVRGAKI